MNRDRTRADNAPPPVIAEQGWRYHHLGIPTETPRPGERYLPSLKMYVSGFETSPFGIEWMRFGRVAMIVDDGCPVELIAFSREGA